MMVDLHTHILPEIDDGAHNLDEALQMAQIAASDGIDRLVATPHQFVGGPSPDPARVEGVCGQLATEIKRLGVPIEIQAAMEVRMTEDILDHLRMKRILTLDCLNRYLLLEPPRTGPSPEFILSVTGQVISAGLVPVIAHPEYSEAFLKTPSLTQLLLRQGAVFQVTASSFTTTGTPQYAFVRSALQKGWIHAVSSDAHDAVHRPPLLSMARAVCERLAGRTMGTLLFETNPSRILKGLDVVRPRTVSWNPWHAVGQMHMWAKQTFRRQSA
jgi:protein-tyrosine phosphatase